MEKAKPISQNSVIAKQQQQHAVSVWDCGSSLYDSFELKSFERQLDSAITSTRSMSMPHLSDHRLPPPVAAAARKRTMARISRSLHRLIRSVFGHKSSTTTTSNGNYKSEGFSFVVYDKSAALSTIPEAPEFDGLSPEMRSLVRRTASDRFSAAAAAAAVGISCV